MLRFRNGTLAVCLLAHGLIVVAALVVGWRMSGDLTNRTNIQSIWSLAWMIFAWVGVCTVATSVSGLVWRITKAELSKPA